MSKRIYIVEDHLQVRESYALFFEEAAGMDVCGAVSTAEEALEEIPGQTPDLVIIDVSLPGMNGLELVKRLRAASPHVRLLVISGHDEARYARPARDSGADGFVRKGDAETILDAIDSVLDGQSFFPGILTTENRVTS